MTSTTEVSGQVVALARGMRDLVRGEAGECERIRTLTDAVVEEMWASGLMSALSPAEAGGVEPSLAEMIDTWIEMAWQDGSFGWIGIANLPSRFAAATYLNDEGFAEVFTAHDNHVTMGGQFFPNGQGVVVEGTAVDAVTLVALETEADLVIVGSKGVDSRFGRIFGAVSVQVLRKSKCDVLVVVP